MNRKQRRATDKKLRKVKGYNAYKRLVEESMKLQATEDMLKDGDRVKLNVKRITGRDEFASLQQAYRDFVMQNQDTVFTAKIRRHSRGGYPVVIDLLEEPTWSFWEGDIIRVRGKD